MRIALTYYSTKSLIILSLRDEYLQEIDISGIACFPARLGKWWRRAASNGVRAELKAELGK